MERPSWTLWATRKIVSTVLLVLALEQPIPEREEEEVKANKMSSLGLGWMFRKLKLKIGVLWANNRLIRFFKIIQMHPKQQKSIKTTSFNWTLTLLQWLFITLKRKDPPTTKLPSKRSWTLVSTLQTRQAMQPIIFQICWIQQLNYLRSCSTLQNLRCLHRMIVIRMKWLTTP